LPNHIKEHRYNHGVVYKCFNFNLKLNNMSLGKVVLGAMAGVATGVLLGVLLAPEKGVDLRKKISKKGKDYSDSVTGKLNEILDSVKNKFETEKERAK